MALSPQTDHVSPTPDIDQRLLGIYLNDHVTGATAGRARVRRMASAYSSLPIGPTFVELAVELDEERTWLLELLDDLGIPVSRHKVLGAAVAERIGRLKLNGHLVRTSRLTPLLEAELLRSGILGKRSLWRTLEAVGDGCAVTAHQMQTLHSLVAQADDQIEKMDAVLDWLRPRALTSP